MNFNFKSEELFNEVIKYFEIKELALHYKLSYVSINQVGSQILKEQSHLV